MHMCCGQYESPSFLGSKRHCSAVSSHTVSKCPFSGLFSASVFACLCFWLEIRSFQRALKQGAEVLSSGPKHKKAVLCFERKHKY